MQLKFQCVFVALMLWAIGCGGDSSTAQVDAHSPLVDMGASDMRVAKDEGGSVDLGSLQRSCAPVCAFLMSQCDDMGEACLRCERLRDTLRPAHENRTWGLCETAMSTRSCEGLTACLADKHGIVAHGNEVQVMFNTGGTHIGLPEINVENAWAIVGSKSDALPSDLEIYFSNADGITMVKIDDAAISDSTGLRTASDHNVEFESAGTKTKFKFGELNFERWSIGGNDAGFIVTGEVREAADSVGVQLRFEGNLSED